MARNNADGSGPGSPRLATQASRVPSILRAMPATMRPFCSKVMPPGHQQPFIGCAAQPDVKQHRAPAQVVWKVADRFKLRLLDDVGGAYAGTESAIETQADEFRQRLSMAGE
jgi:hypothetical protein